MIAGAGSMARAGVTQGLYVAEMIASAILLVGFLMAGTLDKGAKAAVAASREQRAAAAAAGDSGSGSVAMATGTAVASASPVDEHEGDIAFCERELTEQSEDEDAAV